MSTPLLSGLFPPVGVQGAESAADKNHQDNIGVKELHRHKGEDQNQNGQHPLEADQGADHGDDHIADDGGHTGKHAVHGHAHKDVVPEGGVEKGDDGDDDEGREHGTR